MQCKAGCSKSGACRLEGVWRTAFAAGIPVILFIIFWRIYKLKESAVWAAQRGTQDRGRNFGLLMHHFWHRREPSLPGSALAGDWPALQPGACTYLWWIVLTTCICITSSSGALVPVHAEFFGRACRVSPLCVAP